MAPRGKITQIVAQWSDHADFDDLIAIEDRLIESASGFYEVDGHDIGSGEFNVFMRADDAAVDSAVARIVQLYHDGRLAPGMKLAVAVYTTAGRTDWVYRAAFPPGLAEFNVV